MFLSQICEWMFWNKFYWLQDELRENIITIVKQSAAINREGAENMKPRQLSDDIYQEVG